MSDPVPKLQFTGLTHYFRKSIALDGLSAEVDAGVLGVLGPNGAGKTTLLRCLATVLQPQGGEILYGQLTTKAPQDVRLIRRQLGYLPQEASLRSSWTCRQLLQYTAVLKELTKADGAAAVDAALAAVDLADRANWKVRTLSGGMKRRLSLAQALLGAPSILLLDEPTTALDPEQRLRLRALLSELTRQQLVILSTHQTDDVAAICSRVMVVDGGSMLFDGTPGELADLAQGHVWIEERASVGAVMSWRLPDGAVRSIGNAPAEADVVDPTLEDAYLLLLRRGDAAFLSGG